MGGYRRARRGPVRNSAERIKDLKVEMTIVGGSEVSGVTLAPARHRLCLRRGRARAGFSDARVIFFRCCRCGCRALHRRDMTVRSLAAFDRKRLILNRNRLDRSVDPATTPDRARADRQFPAMRSTWDRLREERTWKRFFSSALVRAFLFPPACSVFHDPTTTRFPSSMPGRCSFPRGFLPPMP